MNASLFENREIIYFLRTVELQRLANSKANLEIEVLKDALSFADEKLHEVVVLTNGMQDGKEAIKNEIGSSIKAIQKGLEYMIFIVRGYQSLKR